MEGKVAGQEKFSSWPGRDYCLRKAAVVDIFQAIARFDKGQGGMDIVDNCESGVTRMRILVEEEHLKQAVEAMTTKTSESDGKSICFANYYHSSPSSVSAPRPSFSSLEQRLNCMRKRHLSRSSQITRRVSGQQNWSSWKPALYSAASQSSNIRISLHFPDNVQFF